MKSRLGLMSLVVALLFGVGVVWADEPDEHAQPAEEHHEEHAQPAEEHHEAAADEDHHEAAAEQDYDDDDQEAPTDPFDEDGDGVVEPDELETKKEFEEAYRDIPDAPDENALDARPEDSELKPSLTV